MNFYTYIIYSTELDKFYIGYSSNILDRIKKHKSNHKGFTGKAKDWKLVYSEIFDTKSEALKREKQIKKWKNRNKIIELINGSEHPELHREGHLAKQQYVLKNEQGVP